MRCAVPWVTLALAAACSTSTPPAARTATPTPTVTVTVTVTVPATSAAPTASPSLVGPGWQLGAFPLPLRPDGFGQVLATPAVLRDRRLPTVDVLPAPRDGRFHATVRPVSAAVRARMGETYRPGCPVALADLRYLTLSFRGFDGRVHTGEIVVAARVAQPTVRIFRALFAQRFPIERMRLPTTADLTAHPTGDGNTTAGFVCRASRGQARFSAHAYGLAIDLNPFQNPYRKGDLVLPELASAYTDRSWVRPGMLLPGSAAVRTLTREGFVWGGSYRSMKDWMHFSVTGD